MSKAWGHQVRPLTEQEIEKQIEGGKSWFRWQVDHPQEGRVPDEAKSIHNERKCRISGKCQNESTHMLRYHYVTGKAGRTTWTEKIICEQHAQKYIPKEVTA